jgi:hypothetical protein
MSSNHRKWIHLGVAASVAVLLGCLKSEQSSQSADSAARNLTLAPTESTAAMRDVPAPTPPAPAAPHREPTPPPPPPKPAAPTSFTLPTGTSFGLSASDSISTRSAKPGDPFSATVSQNVRDRSGNIVIPAGSTVSGTIVAAEPAPNPRATGRLELSITNVSVRGRSYPVDLTVGAKDTVMVGRGVTTADAAKVGAGAAAGAVVGKLFGKNTKGAVIGGVLGAAAGGVAANRSRDIDVVLPKGGSIDVELAKPLTVKAH